MGNASSNLEWTTFFFAQTKDFGFIAVTLDGLISDWEGCSERLFGFSREEAVGQPYGIIFTTDDRDKGLDLLELEIARCGSRSEDDRWHQRKDGSRFWGSGVVEAVSAPDGSVRLCKVVRDRTDVVTQTRMLENRFQAEVGKMLQLKERLTTLMHEMSNPVTAMLGTNQRLLRLTDHGESQRTGAVIARQLGTLTSLLDELKALSETPEPQFQLNIKSVVLQDALLSATDGFKELAAAKGQSFNMIVPVDPLVIEVDPDRLQQMVLNLVSNAVKYTPPGGHITVSGTLEEHQIVIRVEDDGVGVAPEALTNIFQMFVREMDGPLVPQGLGVGLSVVKQLAAAHGGGVEARSPGRNMGSIFSIRLPQTSLKRVEGDRSKIIKQDGR